MQAQSTIEKKNSALIMITDKKKRNERGKTCGRKRMDEETHFALTSAFSGRARTVLKPSNTKKSFQTRWNMLSIVGN